MKRHNAIFDTMKTDGKYFIVPTDFLIKNLLNDELWGIKAGCPELVNYDILECIKEIKANGDYPYNSTVGKLFCDKHGLGEYRENTFLASLVYCTQSYQHEIDEEIRVKKFDEEMNKMGFVKCTDEMLNSLVDSNKRFHVVTDRTNLVGADCKKIIEKKLKLKDWKEQGLHWMETRATRRGFRAYAGQYIKEL